MSENQLNLSGLVVFGSYKIIERIGIGAFGEIYKAQNEENDADFIAIKAESVKSKYPQLLFEAKLLQHLHREGSKLGIPLVYNVSIENGYNLMGMELLGKSLDFYFCQMNRKFQLKTVLMIGIQLLDRIESLHESGFIHRDIKPENMLLGNKEKEDLIYLIDVGLGKRFMGEDGHICMRKGNQLVGTLRYASISNHKGWDQSRRDDIESIGYVLVYFLMGSLPWQGLKADSVKSKLEMIKNKKMSAPIEKFYKNLPFELGKLIQYSKNLKFNERPNYDYLRILLREAATKNGIKLDMKYDWKEQNNPEDLMN